MSAVNLDMRIILCARDIAQQHTASQRETAYHSLYSRLKFKYETESSNFLNIINTVINV